MKIIEQITIENNSSLIFAKTTLKNILRENRSNIDDNFLILSLMELSTNLIKYAGGGKIWILEEDSQIFIASLDNGSGIEDLNWAKKKGSSGLPNSLGLGLYQMSSNENYHFEVVTATLKDLHGTVVIIYPKQLKKDIIFLQKVYPGELKCGDMIVKKGRFLLLADGSGHGKHANKSVEFVKSHFYKHPISCLFIDDFFMQLHKELKENGLRGVVLSIFEILKREIQVCGVGNISFWHKVGDEYKYFSQKDGIVGEVFHSSDSRTFLLDKNMMLISATDGVDINKMNKLVKILPNDISPIATAVATLHFASMEYDDASITIIKKED